MVERVSWTHCWKLCTLGLFYELGVFPLVVNGGEDFPQQQREHTDGHDGSDQGEHDA